MVRASLIYCIFIIVVIGRLLMIIERAFNYPLDQAVQLYNKTSKKFYHHIQEQYDMALEHKVLIKNLYFWVV